MKVGPMSPYSKLWWRLARWHVRSRLAYATTYYRATGHWPSGRHTVPLLGLGGFVVSFRPFRPRLCKGSSGREMTADGKYDMRLVRAYRAALAHSLAVEPDAS